MRSWIFQLKSEESDFRWFKTAKLKNRTESDKCSCVTTDQYNDQQLGHVGSVQPYLTLFGSVQPSLIVCRRRNVCGRSCGSRLFSTQTVSSFMFYVSHQTSGIYFSRSPTARLLARTLHCCWFCWSLLTLTDITVCLWAAVVLVATGPDESRAVMCDPPCVTTVLAVNVDERGELL